MRAITIGRHRIGHGERCFVIAEIGCNFTSVDEGRALIDAAREAGADAVKIQTFEPETIASDRAMFDMPNTGVVKQRDVFSRYVIDDAAHARLFEHARTSDILLFSTPSHPRDLERLERLDNPVYKIGSDDAWNLPFLETTARLAKPIILSTGMSTMTEVREAVDAVLAGGNDDLVLLHCLSDYPAAPGDVNLLVIDAFRREFPAIPIGYSDHTHGCTIPWAAVARGACVIEKHFTLDKTADGPDHAMSADPEELARLVHGVREIESALGYGHKRPTAGEIRNRPNNRKSVVATRDIGAGEVISRDAIDVKRPGDGIAPKYFEQVVGRRATRPIAADETLRWDLLG